MSHIDDIPVETVTDQQADLIHTQHITWDEALAEEGGSET